MGYTTRFEGEFALSALPPAEAIVALRQLEGETASIGEGWPESYCQWALTKDCAGIKWDGGEKFYNYVEWLQAIIDKILTPAGLTLSGEVAYQGDEVRDSGVIRIVDNVVKREKAEIVIADLSAFKDFVLASEFGDDLLAGFNRSQARKR